MAEGAHHHTPYFASLFSGACAGLLVDITLFPLDTVKTRLQSASGFRKSGGITRLYSGIPSVAIGSAPSAALFFIAYNASKELLSTKISNPMVAEMIASSIGETIACFVRVPTEVLKQRTQARHSRNVRNALRTLLQVDGASGLYRGFGITLCREIPFSAIQFPLWEQLKRWWTCYQDRPTSIWQSAACGSIAGGIAAGMTPIL
ncbi:unnamed protein product [Soboliphyme baturini]|uniref:S-adenosylmethionine mitochondrial carrier protein n=1 Tax=Soboliphyme baturini TaxID=241478 RepID=A0A183IEV5_9BILA|nr:unnamed protein product [Soboliphyme baturini]